MFEEVTAATFDKRQEAEEALRTLERDGMAVNKMSIVAVEPYEEHALRYFRTSERVLYWAGWAALCGVVLGIFRWSPFRARSRIWQSRHYSFSARAPALF